MRGTWFFGCRLELDAVAGLLWISWCVLGGADFLRVFFFPDFFVFFKRARPVASMRPLCLIYLSTNTGVRIGCNYLMSLSVRLSVCLSV